MFVLLINGNPVFFGQTQIECLSYIQTNKALYKESDTIELYQKIKTASVITTITVN
jgi:hypothetical protein